MKQNLQVVDASDLAQLPDRDLEQMVARARAEQERLKRESARLDVEAQKAEEKFTAEPAAEALTAKEVAKQLSKNARVALEKYERESAPLYTEESRRKAVSRLHELRVAMDWRGAANASAARVVALYQEFNAALAEALADLNTALVATAAHVEEANNLESRVGSGDRPYRKPKFSHALEITDAALRTQIGNPNDGNCRRAAHASYNSSSGSASSQCEVRLRFPAPDAPETWG